MLTQCLCELINLPGLPLLTTDFCTYGSLHTTQIPRNLMFGTTKMCFTKLEFRLMGQCSVHQHVKIMEAIPVLFPGELLSSPEILGALCTLAAFALLFITLMVVGVAGCTDAGIICTAVEQRMLQSINYKLLAQKQAYFIYYLYYHNNQKLVFLFFAKKAHCTKSQC